MAATINPAVSGSTLRRWAIHVAGFAVAVFVAATAIYAMLRVAFAIVAGLLGESAWLIPAGIVVALCVLRDLGVRQAPVPYRDVQVPEWVRASMLPGVTSLIYGAHLGVGFLTRFTYSTHATFLLLLPYVENGLVAVAALAAFAAGKTIILFVAVGHGPFHAFEDRYYARMRAPRYGLRALRWANAAASVATAVAVLFVVKGM